MTESEFKSKTEDLALGIIRFVETLPRNETCRVIGRQLLRSGTSVAANYRAACRARSDADFINKLRIVEEESDESLFWLRLLAKPGNATKETIQPLYNEMESVLKMVVSSIKTKRLKTSNPKPKIQNPKC
jgi:four helix bundle protein